MEFKHISVLPRETIESLNIRPDGIYVDGTIGGGGHSLEIVKRLNDGRLIGIDQDIEALKASEKRLAPYSEKVTLVKDNYVNTKKVLQDLNIKNADGILLDIGVSSYQLENPSRGFSYLGDEPLDMRMDQSNALCAKEIVNTYSREDLTRIFRDYGEERFAPNIAKFIVLERKERVITTTGMLKDIVAKAIPMAVRKHDGEGYAKRVFQALRIETNSELSVLENAIDDLIDLLSPKGRLAIITFHSLEDRIVKNRFRENESPCICPPRIPECVCGRVSKGRAVTKKPIVPSEEEIKENKRAKSAKMRVFEKA